MKIIFLDDLERQFEAVIATADLLCTKEELLAYDETPNRKGEPKRVCNASVIYCREYKKRLRLRGTFFTAPGGARSIIRRAARAWKDLDPDLKNVFELAAQLMSERFQRDHPTYKYRPTKKNKRPQHSMNRASENIPGGNPNTNSPDERPVTTTPNISGEEPATTPASFPGEEPAMPGGGPAGLPSPNTPPQPLPHTTILEQSATIQSLPHTTTQSFNNSSFSMNSPQYYYPSPQENEEQIGSDASSILSSPPDEYTPSLLTPLMTPGWVLYSEPGTPGTILGEQVYPNLSDIEVVVQEEIKEQTEQTEIDSTIEIDSIAEIEGTEGELTIEGEFDRLFGTGHYDYLETIGEFFF